MCENTYKYRCSGCERQITTTEDMVGKAETCPYCGRQNVVGPQQSDVLNTEQLYRSARRGLRLGFVCLLLVLPLLKAELEKLRHVRVVSSLLDLLQDGRFLLPAAALAGLYSVLLGHEVLRKMPRDANLSRPAKNSAWEAILWTGLALLVLAGFIVIRIILRIE